MSADKPATTAAPSRPDLIPVKEITFRQGFVINCGGTKNASAGLKSTDPIQGEHWRLFYDPRIRHHRIEYFAPGAKTPVVRYVPDSWCSWVPA